MVKKGSKFLVLACVGFTGACAYGGQPAQGSANPVTANEAGPVEAPGITSYLLAAAPSSSTFPPRAVPALKTLSPVEYQQNYEESRRLVRADEWLARYRQNERVVTLDEWRRARPLLEQLVAAYPYDGVVWRWLGLAALRTGDHAAGASALVAALELGVPSYPDATAADAAKAFAKAGDHAAAIRWLKAALDDYRHVEPNSLLADPAFKTLQTEPEFVRLAERRQPLQSKSRVERWRADIDFYIAEVKRVKPELPAERMIRMATAADLLKQRVPELGDTEVAVALDQIAGMQQQGHNSLDFWWQRKAILDADPTSGPVDYHLFSDGLYVIAADAEHRHLIGAEVLGFGTISPDEALRRAGTMAAVDNPMGLAVRAPALLSRPQVLHALGLSENPDSWSVSLRLPDGTELNQHFRPTPEFRFPVTALPPPPNTAPPPLYFKNARRFHWMEELDKGILYVQVNLTWNAEEKSLEAFGLDVREKLRSSAIHSVILDLRHNPGGNTYLYHELLRTLVAFDTRSDSQIYVLVGRRTHSAAFNLVVETDRLTGAIIAGEPAHGRPLSPSDAVEITLPNSEVSGGISSTIWALTAPNDTRVWISPTLPVPLTSSDYFSHRDPVMEAVQEHIANRRNSSAR
jgi:hypothetical protein